MTPHFCKSLTRTLLAVFGFVIFNSSIGHSQIMEESDFIIRSPAPIRGQYVTGGYFEDYENPYGMEEIELPPAIVYRRRGRFYDRAEPFGYDAPMFYEW